MIVLRCLQASVKVRASQDNVAGVKLPKFERLKEGGDGKLGLIGLGSGGKQIQECRCAADPRALARMLVGPPACLACSSSADPAYDPLPPLAFTFNPPISLPAVCSKSFMSAVDLLVELASLQVRPSVCLWLRAFVCMRVHLVHMWSDMRCGSSQAAPACSISSRAAYVTTPHPHPPPHAQTAFLTLDEAIKTTNRRVNALEHVVKPRLENTIAYIKVGVGLGLGLGSQRCSRVGARCCWP